MSNNTKIEYKQGPDEDMDWMSAKKWVDSLGGDWRLPYIEELFSLRNGISWDATVPDYIRRLNRRIWSREGKFNKNTYNYGRTKMVRMSHKQHMRVIAIREVSGE